MTRKVSGGAQPGREILRERTGEVIQETFGGEVEWPPLPEEEPGQRPAAEPPRRRLDPDARYVPRSTCPECGRPPMLRVSPFQLAAALSRPRDVPWADVVCAAPKCRAPWTITAGEVARARLDTGKAWT